MKIRDGFTLCQKQSTEIEWLVQGLIPLGVCGDIFSMPDCGKTTIFLSLLSAIANGNSHWFSFKIVSGNVAYVGGEKSSDEVWTRDLHRASAGIEEEGRFTNYDPENALWVWKNDMWNETDEYAELVNELKHVKPVITVIDTISRVAMGNNPVDLTQQVMLAQAVERFQKAIEGTVLTISHTNQASMNETLSNRLHYVSRSGGNGYPGWLRWLCGMTNLNVTEKERLGIDEYAKIVSMAVSKHNEMPQPMPRGNRFNPILFEITRNGELLLIDKNCESVDMPAKRQNKKAVMAPAKSKTVEMPVHTPAVERPVERKVYYNPNAR
jgi:RecA-family ATPase